MVIDRDILNFERFKWGGVRRADLTYIWLDLELFASADRPRPTVLETPDHPGYADRFVSAEERPLPNRRFVDQAYPTCWWMAEHGVNREAARALGLL